MQRKWYQFFIILPLALLLADCAPPERTLRRMALKWELNPDATRLNERAIEINSTPEKIWEIMTSPNEWPEWYPRISRARANDRVRGGSSFIWEMDRKHHTNVIQDDKPFRIIWFSRTLFDVSLTRWTIEIIDKNRSRVTLSESRDGFFLYMIMSNEEHQNNLNEWLQHLKERVENPPEK